MFIVNAIRTIGVSVCAEVGNISYAVLYGPVIAKSLFTALHLCKQYDPFVARE